MPEPCHGSYRNGKIFLDPRSYFEPGGYQQGCFGPRGSVTEGSPLGFGSSPRVDPPLSLVLAFPTLHHHDQHSSRRMTSFLLQTQIHILMQINSKKASSSQCTAAVLWTCPAGPHASSVHSLGPGCLSLSRQLSDIFCTPVLMCTGA